MPVTSPEGQRYLGAMAAAANYARANRQLLAEAASRVLGATASTPLHLVYDVSHNLATLEAHQVDEVAVRLCVHRKGAARALPPGHADLPAGLREAGQPVLIPGSMGTSSYVLAGVAGGDAFASACHGAGRLMSRHQAARSIAGPELRRRLERQGIAVRGASARGLAEGVQAALEHQNVIVAMAAHELHNPLAAISVLAHVLQDQHDTMTPAQRAQIIDQIAERTARLQLLLRKLQPCPSWPGQLLQLA